MTPPPDGADFFDIGGALETHLSTVQKRMCKELAKVPSVSWRVLASCAAGRPEEPTPIDPPAPRLPQRRKASKVPFNPEAFISRAERVAAKGGSDFDVAKALSIDETTLLFWFLSCPALEDAVEKGRDRWRKRVRRLRRPRCHKCGGWLDVAFEIHGEGVTRASRAPRCLNCGKRYYRGMTPVIPCNQKGGGR